MEFSSLFNYPGTESNNKTEELIFLAKQSAEEWSTILDYTEIYIFKKGEVVIHKGDTSRVLYIVKNGALEVFIPQKNNFSGKRISLIEKGSVFGEQSFFDGRARSASVRGVTDGEMMSLSLEAFNTLAARETELARNILFDLARLLSIRLRQTTLALMDISR